MAGMMMSATLPPLTFVRALSEWSLHPWAAVVLGVLLAAYIECVGSAWAQGVRWRSRDVAAWVGGVVVLVIATQGSPAVYGNNLFYMHMVGHLLLIMVAPILLVAGRPLDLALAAVGTDRAPRLRTVFDSRAVSGLLHPGTGLLLYGLVIVGTHLTGFMNSMMMHPWLAGLEQWMYVVTGVIFFLPLTGDQPIRWKLAAPLRMAVLLVAMPIDTFTGVVLAQTTNYPWPMMLSAHEPWALSPISDLHTGGAVMWVGGDAIMAVMFGLAAVAWARAASDGDGSELGGWLSAARLNYQTDLLAPRDTDQELVSVGGATTAAAAPDSDEAHDAYNAYLERLSREP